MIARSIPTSHCDIFVSESDGTSTPVLLIHGNSSSGEVFRNQMGGALGARFRLIAVDLPGHGRSTDAVDPPRTYTMPGYADAMTELLQRMEIGRAIVFGWSLGGHIGLEMISRYPGLVGLMITGTPPVSLGADGVAKGFKTHPHMASAGKRLLTPEEIEAYARATCGGPYEPFLRENVARTDGRARETMFASLLAGRGDDQRTIIETTKTPLAVVNGAEEPFVNIDYVSSLRYSSLWEGRCHVLPGLGHAPFWEAPAVFDPILARFITDMERRVADA